jgi:F-type H+-transporting ATPase subunit epsilon
MAKLQCVIVTPERAVLDEGADFVVLPMYDGELGVLHDRLPLIGRLGFGELRLVQDRAVRRYYVDGGFAQVRDNIVTVLTSKAIPAEQIETGDALETLENAQRAIATAAPEQAEAQLRLQERARAQLRIARKGDEVAPV